ncbi:MAG: nucleotidyltransferase family protein [Bacteroidaceae bacterium]|nr:nucleotidyltransferase family protein [Bacteroidaceae bacterium]
MRTRSEYIKTIRSHAAELQQRFGITSMRLFGSVARNEHREGSDVDLFVTMPAKFYNHVAAVQYLENLLGCGVDLVQDHRNMRPFFRKQIERDGVNIFSSVTGS